MRHQIAVVGGGELHERLVADLVRFGLEAFPLADVATAQARAAHDPPDLMIVELAPGGSVDLEQLERLVMDPATATVLILVVVAETARAEHQAALRSGVDALVTVPYDPADLVWRVRNLLRRASHLRSLSPLTGLPGNRAIVEAFDLRLASSTPVALVHIDIDDFKRYNDRHGFMHGDAVILMCADSVRTAAEMAGGDNVFVGHIGGDDFAVILDAGDVDLFCKTLVGLWEDAVANRSASSAPGALDSDRTATESFEPMTLSIGVATNRHRSLASAWEASAIAAEMKEYAKRYPGSHYRVDRRRR